MVYRTAPPPTWSGSQIELAEFLAIVKDGCRECGRNTTLHTPCKDHTADAIFLTYTQREVDLLVGEKHDPYWMGPLDRGVSILRKED